jgi:hypothetical protein
VHLLHDLREHGRLISRPGSNLQHAMGRRELERLRHVGDDVRLRDRLSEPDWKRAVVVGDSGQIRRDEAMARHRSHRGEHLPIGNPTGRDLIGDHHGARVPQPVAPIAFRQLAQRAGIRQTVGRQHRQPEHGHQRQSEALVPIHT